MKAPQEALAARAQAKLYPAKEVEKPAEPKPLEVTAPVKPALPTNATVRERAGAALYSKR
jgi:hypothetical protein